MSLVHNIVGGAGGGIAWDSAIIHAYAPAGSTVTATDGTTTKTAQEHTVSGADSEYLFYIKASEYGEYTLTATLGEEMAEKTITVADNKEYTVKLSYIVPREYQAVEYIEGTGTQWINIPSTDFDSATDLILELTFSTKPSYRFFLIGNVEIRHVDSTHFTSDVMLEGAGTNVEIIADKKYNIETHVINASSFIISGDLSHTRKSGNIRVPQDGIRLISTTKGIANGRIYYSAVKVNNDYKLELIPCFRKSDNVAGMWDRVGKTFYTNAGTGTFVVGEPI